jgi:ATP-binding cassette subfamily B protein
MFEPTDGKIFIGERNIQEFSLGSLRRYVGFVPQESFLFSDTIAENIAFGVEEASQEIIELAASDAQLLDTVTNFEKKFMTVLGERGITLSGGQKQRTSIARALIKKPGILILDDSLSAVDSKTEDALKRVLRDNMSGSTTIMIAHRLSTIKHCDTIFVLENGEIVEEGNHDTLIKRAGVYASLYDKQLIEQELEAL